MKYIRKINLTEAKRFFIKIDAEHFPMFPGIKEEFTLVVKKKKFEVNIDRQRRLWAFKFRSLVDFSHDSIFEITKDEENIFYLKQIDLKKIFKD